MKKQIEVEDVVSLKIQGLKMRPDLSLTKFITYILSKVGKGEVIISPDKKE